MGRLMNAGCRSSCIPQECLARAMPVEPAEDRYSSLSEEVDGRPGEKASGQDKR
jgi:hypothetical protein